MSVSPAEIEEALDAAEVDPRPVRHLQVLVALFTLAIVCVEMAILTLFYDGSLPVLTAGAAHLGVVGLVAVVTFVHRRRRGRAQPAFVLLFVSVALLGPLGAIGTLIAILLHLISYRHAEQFEDWYASLFSDEELNEFSADSFESMLAEVADEHDDALSVGSFTDILSHGTRRQKNLAIAMMTRYFNPAFANALRQALRDPDNSIRVQAATAMTTIENNFVTQATELDEKAKDNPNDHTVLKELARHHDDYAFTGVLDSQREEHNREQALAAYLEYLKHEPRDADAHRAATRLLVRVGRFQEAVSWLERCRQQGIWSAEMVPWYLECLYRTGRLEEVRHFMRQHYDDLTRIEDYPIQLVEAARLWAGEDTARADRSA